MATGDAKLKSDIWYDWLLHYRHADDPGYQQILQSATERYADRVLLGARLGPDMTLVDVGTGEGLVAFRALEQVGASVRVVLTDISEPVLRHVEALSIQHGVRDQCRFHHCGADKLHGVDSASADVVTTRAVLVYVADKAAAFGEFFRVLKPGGRLSIAEPVMQDDAFAACALRQKLETQSPDSRDPFEVLLHRWRASEVPDTLPAIMESPLANWSERDLVTLAQKAGFSDIHMEFHVDVFPSTVRSWDVFLGIATHPWTRPLGKLLQEKFSDDERQFFEQRLRPVIESGQSLMIERSVYLQAVKPADRKQ